MVILVLNNGSIKGMSYSKWNMASRSFSVPVVFMPQSYEGAAAEKPVEHNPCFLAGRSFSRSYTVADFIEFATMFVDFVALTAR